MDIKTRNYNFNTALYIHNERGVKKARAHSKKGTHAPLYYLDA
jgi:hypothetical protein